MYDRISKIILTLTQRLTKMQTSDGWTDRRTSFYRPKVLFNPAKIQMTKCCKPTQLVFNCHEKLLSGISQYHFNRQTPTPPRVFCRNINYNHQNVGSRNAQPSRSTISIIPDVFFTTRKKLFEGISIWSTNISNLRKCFINCIRRIGIIL